MNKNIDQTSIELNGQFVYSQLLIDLLLQLKPDEKDKRELIGLCRKLYEDNQTELVHINRFDQEYCSSESITWYTMDCFLYRILNRALRVQNIHVLYLLRSVIRDIAEQLKQVQMQKHIQTYRGQLISSEEMNRLRYSIGKLISINSFFSTSMNRAQALEFLRVSGNSKDEQNSGQMLENVLFEIDADPIGIISNSLNRPFGDISSISKFSDEDEVLFMIGSIFRLNHVCSHQPSLSIGNKMEIITIVRMTLCTSYDEDLEQLYTTMKNHFIETKETSLALSKLLIKMGKISYAEKYLFRLLGEFSSDDAALVDLYHLVGKVTDAKENYDESLKWYRKSLEVSMRLCPSDYIKTSNAYNSMGIVYRKKGETHQALVCFNQAVSLFEEANKEKYPNIALFYGNIAYTYHDEKKYEDALSFYEKALTIQKQHLPSSHADIGASYMNIGVIHRCLGRYDQALDNYKQSLEIQLRSLPSDHLDIATTYKNIGVLYEKKSEWKQALVYFENASTIFHKVLRAEHPNIMKIQKAIQYTTRRLQM